MDSPQEKMHKTGFYCATFEIAKNFPGIMETCVIDTTCDCHIAANSRKQEYKNSGGIGLNEPRRNPTAMRRIGHPKSSVQGYGLLFQ